MFYITNNYNLFRSQLKVNARSENLERYSDKEYDNFKVYANFTGTVGFAITPSNELVNLFNNSGIKGAGAHAIRTAIELGATRLNCFDGPLVKYYESFGFIEFARAKFSIAYAPPGWHNSMGRPDIIFMEILK
jgi:hypothetical protein